MSIFGTIMGKIFGSHAEAAPAAPATGAAPTSATPGATPIQTTGETPKIAPSSEASPQGTAQKSVEVAPILDDAVKAKGEKLEWRTSIVDLMKALDIDSSLTARKELAKELNYTGDTNDSATMNVWLHKEVVAKLAANGGKLPADMKH